MLTTISLPIWTQGRTLLTGDVSDISEGKGINIQTGFQMICGALAKGRVPSILPRATLVLGLSYFDKKKKNFETAENSVSWRSTIMIHLRGVILYLFQTCILIRSLIP